MPIRTPCKDFDVALEVVEDVQVDGIVVIRKGALAKGRVFGLTKGKTVGRRATLNFMVDSVTAVDGQTVALDSAVVERKGTSAGGVAGGIASHGGLLGGLVIPVPRYLCVPEPCGRSQRQRK